MFFPWRTLSASRRLFIITQCYLSKDQYIFETEYNNLCHPLISLRNKLRGNRAANVVLKLQDQGSERVAAVAEISLVLPCPSETIALKPGMSDFLVKQLPKCQIPVSYLYIRIKSWVYLITAEWVWGTRTANADHIFLPHNTSLCGRKS